MKAFLQSPVGVIEIGENNGYISSVRIVDKITQKESGTSPILDKAISQLTEYFEGKRKNFELPLKQSGTEFQKRVWDYLSTIPYGETVSYKAEAIAVSSEKAFRAVGSANGKNNIAIIVPCHRVVNEGGKLGGYAYGLEIKQQLLNLEKCNKDIL